MQNRSTPLPFLGVAARSAPAARLSYAAAAALAAGAVLMTRLVPPLAERTTFFLPIIAIVLACWTAGWRAGVVSGLTAFALVLAALAPAGGWFGSAGDLLRLSTFAAATAAILAFARAHERTEARLRESEALSRIIIDNGPVLITGADAQGNVAIFNRACEQLTGYTRDEVIGRPFLETFVPQTWQSVVAARFRDEPIEVLAQPHENPWVTKSRSERLIEWRCFRVQQHDGSPITLGVGQDVTERHAAESRVQEGLARERAAHDALAAANQRKEQFIALLAHELRTPLNAAMGWFHILRTGKAHNGVEQAPAAVERNLQMMHALIEDIVDFNRAEFGKLELKRSRLAPATLLSDVVTSARSLAEAREIELLAAVPDGLPAIDADEKRLRQVMLNVLGNALKFTPPGGQVRVSARVDHEAGLAISVRDNGHGIPADQLDHIFDPHWQQP
ncbi:MAG TPA: ATP-binding protein, partial [Vicinamibacterales bacterium]